jgi:hypothetical protein
MPQKYFFIQNYAISKIWSEGFHDTAGISFSSRQIDEKLINGRYEFFSQRSHEP